MADNPNEPAESAEMRTIRQLVRLMARFDLTAIDLGDGPSRIRLRRRGTEAHSTPTSLSQPVSIPSAPIQAQHLPPAPEKSVATPSGVFIESPMVGTFYASSAPDSPSFVSIGTKVRADSIVCVIEAMKVFTDIPAGVSGTVVEIIAKNGQPVEFGQHLFRIEPE